METSTPARVTALARHRVGEQVVRELALKAAMESETTAAVRPVEAELQRMAAEAATTPKRAKAGMSRKPAETGTTRNRVKAETPREPVKVAMLREQVRVAHPPQGREVPAVTRCR